MPFYNIRKAEFISLANPSIHLISGYEKTITLFIAK